MFLPGLGKLHCCDYRVHTGMMIGLETELAQGKLQYVPRYLGIACLFQTRSPCLPKHRSHGWESVSVCSRSKSWRQGRRLVTLKASSDGSLSRCQMLQEIHEWVFPSLLFMDCPLKGNLIHSGKPSHEWHQPTKGNTGEQPDIRWTTCQSAYISTCKRILPQGNRK